MSFFGDLNDSVAHLGSDFGKSVGSFWDNDIGKNGLFSFLNKKPDLSQPTTSAPTLAQANTTAIQNQLGAEKNATSAILTGGAGLLDEPTTTSALLTGT